ncbi:MAG: PRC-barrel domain-containing protein [Clostridia bacterium]|jgi:uncharacterized protein YrrD|nr:PRC-barrel domain-containing protein [Clostridia bacterium]
MFLRSKELIGLPVISLEEGQQLGVVRELVIDREEACVAAIVISPKGFLKESRVIPYTKVQSVGSHAVTVAKATHVDKSLSQQLTKLTSRSLDDTRIITDKGNALGTVDDVIINAESGKIAFLEINGNLLEGILKKQATLSTEFIKTIGKDVIVASAEAETNLIYSESSLQHKFKNVSDSTVKVLENTWNKTKDLGKNLPLFKINGSSVELNKTSARKGNAGVEETEAVAGSAENSSDSSGVEPIDSTVPSKDTQVVQETFSLDEVSIIQEKSSGKKEKINPGAR